MMSALPRILFFNINGTGMGHLSRCLAYARRMRGRATAMFFSLASAVEVIRDMGFEADYFVSESWTRSSVFAWNRELAVRVGLMLEEIRPDAIVFDGTWPFHGLMDACDTHRVPIRVWSNRGFHKEDFGTIPVPESAFDLVIVPGEIGAGFSVERSQRPGRKVTTQPVTLLEPAEVLSREAAREALGLQHHDRYVLFSLGSFNDTSGMASGLSAAIRKRGMRVVWTGPPIALRDAPPTDAMSVSVYPVARFMRAFDFFIGAAGYNTCCEVIQSAVPSLLVPNPIAADDQAMRAEAVSRYAPVVVSACETERERDLAVSRLLEFHREPVDGSAIGLAGAEQAAGEILALLYRQAAA